MRSYHQLFAEADAAADRHADATVGCSLPMTIAAPCPHIYLRDYRMETVEAAIAAGKAYSAGFADSGLLAGGAGARGGCSARELTPLREAPKLATSSHPSVR